MKCEICKTEIDPEEPYAISNDECYICDNCCVEIQYD